MRSCQQQKRKLRLYISNTFNPARPDADDSDGSIASWELRVEGKLLDDVSVAFADRGRGCLGMRSEKRSSDVAVGGCLPADAPVQILMLRQEKKEKKERKPAKITSCFSAFARQNRCDVLRSRALAAAAVIEGSHTTNISGPAHRKWTSSFSFPS